MIGAEGVCKITKEGSKITCTSVFPANFNINPNDDIYMVKMVISWGNNTSFDKTRFEEIYNVLKNLRRADSSLDRVAKEQGIEISLKSGPNGVPVERWGTSLKRYDVGTILYYLVRSFKIANNKENTANLDALEDYIIKSGDDELFYNYVGAIDIRDLAPEYRKQISNYSELLGYNDRGLKLIENYAKKYFATDEKKKKVLMGLIPSLSSMNGHPKEKFDAIYAIDKDGLAQNLNLILDTAKIDPLPSDLKAKLQELTKLKPLSEHRMELEDQIKQNNKRFEDRSKSAKWWSQHALAIMVTAGFVLPILVGVISFFAPPAGIGAMITLYTVAATLVFVGAPVFSLVNKKTKFDPEHEQEENQKQNDMLKQKIASLEKPQQSLGEKTSITENTKSVAPVVLSNLAPLPTPKNEEQPKTSSKVKDLIKKLEGNKLSGPKQ